MIQLLMLLWLFLFETADSDAGDDDTADGATDDDSTDDGEDDDELTAYEKRVAKDKMIRDERLFKASTQAKRYRLQLRDAEGKLTALPVLRLENAFLKATRGQTLDVETAWDLFLAKGFADTMKVADDGEILIHGQGSMDTALRR